MNILVVQSVPEKNLPSFVSQSYFTLWDIRCYCGTLRCLSAMQLTDAEYVLLRDCRVVAVAALAPGLRVGAGPRPGQLAADALGGIARRPLGPTAVPFKAGLPGGTFWLQMLVLVFCGLLFFL